MIAVLRFNIAKFLFAYCILLLFTIRVSAQQNEAPLTRNDTINLRGFVYQSNGDPARVWIESHFMASHFVYRIFAVTDTTGYFEMKGIRPADTLYIEGSFPGGGINYKNNGSRYIIIYLPAPKTIDLNSQSPIEVSAPRKYPKQPTNFKIEADNTLDGGSVEIAASFVSGLKGFIDYIQKRMQYPEKAIDLNIEGTVEIGFDVERDGTLVNFKVLKGLGYGCEEEVISILKNSPRWRPQIINGKPKITHETVSVQFKLTE